MYITFENLKTIYTALAVLVVVMLSATAAFEVVYMLRKRKADKRAVVVSTSKYRVLVLYKSNAKVNTVTFRARSKKEAAAIVRRMKIQPKLYSITEL